VIPTLGLLRREAVDWGWWAEHHGTLRWTYVGAHKRRHERVKVTCIDGAWVVLTPAPVPLERWLRVEALA
jgi:hypothetical protein